MNSDPSIFKIRTVAEGPAGSLPLTAEMLLEAPSGTLFGWSQDAGMGWDPAALGGKEFLILSTQGGIRSPDGSPEALGYHTGHWEVGLLMQEAALRLRRAGCTPFAGYCTDPCDGRSQGTAGMYDSLAYRNDAAIVLRRLIRSLPMRRGVLGVATCDKGHPAMMMALAGAKHLPGIIIPGGVSLPPANGEDAGSAQTIGARFAHELITLEEAADIGCRACATPGGGCQFFGTAATSQVVGEALGLSVPHAALAPSGQPVWLDVARRSVEALLYQEKRGLKLEDILTQESVRNAMVVHAACGGSTNLLLHIPAVAHAAGLRRPAVTDWIEISKLVPRIVSVLPNGPVHHPTVRLFLAGGVPEVMLQLSRLNVLDTRCLTATGQTLENVLRQWERSERRARFRQILLDSDGVDADSVIMSPEEANRHGMRNTMAFPVGNLAPDGSVIKSTAIDPSLTGADGVYRHRGPARVFTSERAAIAAIKSTGAQAIQRGDVVVLAGRGPMGSGMEETYQLTSALKHLPWGSSVALVTDARFSGVSTGACIGHVGPEALAGGPIGRVVDGDMIQIEVDCNESIGRIDLVGHGDTVFGPEEGSTVLTERRASPAMHGDESLPADTALWAALQDVSGGTWGGCVYDLDAISEVISAGKHALGR